MKYQMKMNMEWAKAYFFVYFNNQTNSRQRFDWIALTAIPALDSARATTLQRLWEE